MSILNKLNFHNGLFILALFFLHSIDAQIAYPGKPLYRALSDTHFVPVLQIEEIPVPLKTKSDGKEQFKVDHFASKVELALNPFEYGAWYDYPSLNKRICLLKVKAQNASSLSFWFEKYQLKPGGKLFLYNPDQSTIIGALTHQNNKSWNHLATSTIEGSEVILEFQTPMDRKDYGQLIIGNAYVGFSKVLKTKSVSDDWFGQSAYCQENINCFDNPVYQNQKRAVCRIVFIGERCTGTVLNNFKNDQTPYVITAAHCFTSEYIANQAVFDFNYESPGCEDENSPFNSVSGASIVSFSENLDFLLLRLSENIPVDYDVLYSGWDARGVTSDSAFLIHHPLGDVKKISIENDAPYTSTYPGFDDNTFWTVDDYEYGSTEFGSSGGGLVSDKGLLIGTLTGGGGVCTPVIVDRYQKFSHSYNDYSPEDEQLKAWLDPESSNVLVCNSLDASNGLRNSAEVLTNVDVADNLEVTQQNQDWGYISGHNYQNNSVFAEHFEVNGSKYLYGANIYPGKLYSLDSLSSITFKLWDGKVSPDNIIYEKDIYIDDLDLLAPYNLDFDSTILIHKSFFAGYQINYVGDTFAIHTSNADALTNSAYTFLDNSWMPLQKDGVDLYSHLNMEVLAFDFLPDKVIIVDITDFPQPFIYPNPSNGGIINVFFKRGVSGSISFELFNTQGTCVYAEQVFSPESNYPIIHNLQGGIYILRIKQNNKLISTQKLLVL